jgi:pimeloyl-ACP methyl ester carboxylesterase
MKVNLSDTKLFVEQAGRGQPLLLIHGFPFNHEMWRPQIETLAGNSKIIAPDLRGHGQSPPTPGPYSMDMLADDCASVLEKLGVQQPVTVCGLSMGGYVSFAFFRRYPQLVAGLILVATRSGADAEEAKKNRDIAAEKVRTEGTQPVIESMLPIAMSPTTYQKQTDLVQQVEGIMQKTTPEGLISALMGMKSRPDSTPTLDKITVPTLILHGADDQIIPTSEAEAMHAAIQGSQFIIVPDAGHLPNLEQPQIFNQAVDGFLAGLKV